MPRSRPTADVRNDWQPPEADTYVRINESIADDGTFLRSPIRPAGEVYRVKFAALRDPSTNARHVLQYRVRAGKVVAGLVLRVAVVTSDGTVIEEWEHDDLTTSFQTRTRTLSPSNAALITDYADVCVEFDPYQNVVDPGVNDRSARVSWVSLTVPDVVSADRALRVSWANVRVGGSPLAKLQHPRLWLTDDTRDAQRAKLATGGRWATDYQTWITYLEGAYTAAPVANPELYGQDIALDCLNFAFAWQMRQDGTDGTSASHHPTGITATVTPLQFARKAIELLKNINLSTGLTGARSGETAIAYDWLYGVTDGDGSTVWQTTVADALAVRYTTTLVGDLREGMPLDDLHSQNKKRAALAALACWGDGVRADVFDPAMASVNGDDTTLPDGRLVTGIRDTTVGGILLGSVGGVDGSITANNWWAGNAGGWSDGLNYAKHGGTKFAANSWLAYEGWRTATGTTMGDAYQGDNCPTLRHMAEWFLYMTYPEKYPGVSTNKHRMRVVHHTGQNGAEFTESGTMVEWVLLTIFSQDDDATVQGVAQWYLDNRTLGQGGGITTMRESWVRTKFLMSPTTAPTAVAPTGVMPLVKYFENQEGTLYSRTNWTATDATYVAFMAPRYMRRPEHYSDQCSGHFDIARGGALTNLGGTEIHYSFGSKTTAANTIVFGHTEGGIPRTAGEQRDQGASADMDAPSVQAVPGSGYDRTGIIATHTDSTRWAYAKADVTRAYPCTQTVEGAATDPAYLRRFVRCFTHLRRTGTESDWVIVYDRVDVDHTTSAGTITPLWLFQCPVTPVSTGTLTAASAPVRGTRNTHVADGSNDYIEAGGHGHATYTAAPLDVTSRSINGQRGTCRVTPVLGTNEVYVIAGANENGTWARSRGGRNATFTKTGTTVTVTLANHAYVTGWTVVIARAGSAFDGAFTITVLDASTFTYTTNATAGGPLTGRYVFEPVSHEFEDIFGRVRCDNKILYSALGGVTYANEGRMEFPLTGTDIAVAMEVAAGTAVGTDAPVAGTASGCAAIVLPTLRCIVVHMTTAGSSYTASNPGATSTNWAEAWVTPACSVEIPSAGVWEVLLTDLPASTAVALSGVSESGEYVRNDDGSGAPFVSASGGVLPLTINVTAARTLSVSW